PATTYTWQDGGNDFGPLQSKQLQSSGAANGWTATLGDVNGDGKTDVIYTYTLTGEKWVAYSLSTGSDFGPLQTTRLQASGAADGWIATVGDVNGDGKADVIYLYPDKPETLTGQ